MTTLLISRRAISQRADPRRAISQGAISQRADRPSPAVWALPEQGLHVFYGLPEALHLFHYFLPRAILGGKRVLCLDGGNRFDPLLIARFARERGMAAGEFGSGIRVARAFTCFQLTELLVRMPRLLGEFPASVAIVTALPDLYFDEDVREREAVFAFRRALEALRAAERRLPVAVFTDATSGGSPRRGLFQELIREAAQVLRFRAQEGAGVSLSCTRAAPGIGAPRKLP
jgi:hypothetical protein